MKINETTFLLGITVSKTHIVAEFYLSILSKMTIYNRWTELSGQTE